MTHVIRATRVFYDNCNFQIICIKHPAHRSYAYKHVCTYIIPFSSGFLVVFPVTCIHALCAYIIIRGTCTDGRRPETFCKIKIKNIISCIGILWVLYMRVVCVVHIRSRRNNSISRTQLPLARIIIINTYVQARRCTQTFRRKTNYYTYTHAYYSL